MGGSGLCGVLPLTHCSEITQVADFQLCVVYMPSCCHIARWVNNRSTVVKLFQKGGVSVYSHWIRFIREYLIKCGWEENFQQRRISKINPLMSREEQKV